MLKNAIYFLLTAALLLAGPIRAADLPPPIPVVVAESNDFEIVGRLSESGLVFHVDWAPTNVPVLAANLEVEIASRKAVARFRPETGDYLIDDAAWLKPLRAPGEYALALTLVAGAESDLLSGDLTVFSTSTAEIDSGSSAYAGWPLLGLGIVLGAIAMRRFGKGGRA